MEIPEHEPESDDKNENTSSESTSLNLKNPRTEKIRKWQILEKETGLRFYFDGRIVLGPNMALCWTLLIHMTITVGLFLCYDGNRYMEGRLHLFGDWGVPACIILMYFLNILAIFKTILTEPGYIPKPEPEEQRKNFLKYLGQALRSNNLKSISTSSENGNYCQICQMFRQRQVSHCRTCNVCFKRNDHHCDFLGVCIGQRNHPSFFVFTITVFVFYVTILLLGTSHLLKVLMFDSGKMTADKFVFPSFYVTLMGFLYPPCGLFTLFVTPFVHSYLILTNRTTKDFNRKIWPENKPNNSKDWISTCISNSSRILFGQYIISDLNAREEIEVPLGYLKNLKRSEKPALTQEFYEDACAGDMHFDTRIDLSPDNI